MGSLADIPVAVLDAQATGPASRQGRVIELGWARIAGGDGGTVRSSLVALPAGVSLPARVSKLTGIRAADLQGAPAEATVWSQALASLCASGAPTLAVAHFARYEQGLLEALHQRCRPHTPFPFALLCTHQIARRLLPELPRRGLHALAGYFGQVIPRRRRAAVHVRATITVWRELVGLLAQAHPAIDSPAALRSWLREGPIPPRRTYVFPLAREQRLALPDAPGVYRFLSSGGTLLYVGKAHRLRRRVSSHYHGARRQGRRTDPALELLSQVRDVQATVTETALEAALLEVDEIQRHLPPYNTALRPRGAFWFLSPDLTTIADRWHPDHPRGPIPAREEAVALAGLVRLLRGDPLPADLDGFRRAIGDPADPVVAGALARLRRRCAGWGAPARAVIALGRRLWWRSPDNQPDDGNGDGDDLDPESRALQRLERIAMAGAHQLRRARWLARLSECTVSWTPPERPSARVLVLREGRIVGRLGGDPAAGTTQPWWHRPHPERIRALDPLTYDRLRVLTTEIRALLQEGVPVAIRLRPERALDQVALATCLSWT